MENKSRNTENIGKLYSNHAIIVNEGKVKLVKLLDNGETSIVKHDDKVKRIEFSQTSDFK